MSQKVAIGAATVQPTRGGIARVARISAAALAEAGHSVWLNAFLDSDSVPILDVPISCSSGKRLRFTIRAQAAAFKTDWTLYDTAGIARARPRLPGLRRPYAVWMHGVEAWEDLRPGAAAALQEADLVIVNSHYTLRRYQSLHGALPSARVCWLATDDDEPAPRASPAGMRAPTVLVLGRIEASESYKGHAELIEAWPKVVSQVPEARLVIAGSGSGLSAISSAAAASPVASQIDILGFVPEDAVSALWTSARAFAMPSRGEGFGLVYAEAMRHGVPVIVSRHDAGQEIIQEGRTGFAVSLDSGEELATRLVALLADDGLASAMGEAGRQRWAQHFRFTQFKDRFLTLTDACFQPRRAHARKAS